MEVCLRQIARDVAHPGVGRQRTAADLLRRDDDFAAMLDYARSKGWLSDDGASIRAHVEWG